MEEKEKKKSKLKIIIPVVVAIVIIAIVGIVLFRKNKGSNESKVETPILQIGETYTIKGGEFEITLKDIQYASKATNTTLCGSLDENFLKAGDYADSYYYGGQYHSNIYNPKDNEASVSVFFDIKYLGKEQKGFTFNWDLDYNNGIIIKDNRGNNTEKRYWNGTSWGEYSIYTVQYEPLGINQREIRQFLSVPAEVMDNKEAPLKLNIVSSDYDTIYCTYIIR